MEKNRRSIRLKGYDYSQEGAYFVTICCSNKIHKFGIIKQQTMLLNELGILAQKEWEKLAERYENIALGAFVVMPNHIHFILTILKKERYTLGQMIGAYKSLVVKTAIETTKAANPEAYFDKNIWHRNYYEHIIRNETAYDKISDYIINNPINWQKQADFYQKLEAAAAKNEDYENFAKNI